jgi:hypothetical protein
MTMTDATQPAGVQPAVVQPAAVQTEEAAERTAPKATPLVLDLGKRGKKTIRRLRQGRGPAMAEVMDVMEQVQAQLGDDAQGKVLLPVVVVYGRKRRRARGPWF